MNRLRAVVPLAGALILGVLLMRWSLAQKLVSPHPQSTAAASSSSPRPTTPSSNVAPFVAQLPGRATGSGTRVPILGAHREELLRKIQPFTDWLAQWRQTGPQHHVILAQSGQALAAVRRAALKELIPLDPQAALAATVPRSLRAELPAGVVSELESPIDAFGEYAVTAVCFDEQDRIERSALVGGVRYEVYTYGQRLAALSKSRLALHGAAIDGLLALAPEPYRRLEGPEAAAVEDESGALTVAAGDEHRTFPTAAALQSWAEEQAVAEAAVGPNSNQPGVTVAAATASWVFGEKTVLWLRTEFSDDPGSPATDQEITDSMAAVNSYYQEVSRGRTSFKTTIFPGTLPVAATNASADNYSAISDAALKQARAYDAAHGGTGLYNPDRYDRWIVIFKLAGSFDAAGRGSMGGVALWLNGTTAPRVVAHELGHNHGLSHSHAWNPTAASPISPGKHNEYGDVFDVMGSGGQSITDALGAFNTKQKNSILYLEPVETPAVTTSGVYRIYRHDHAGATGVQALNIPAGTAYDYWLEYRRQIPGNLNSYPSAINRLKNGVTVRWGKRPSFTSGSGTYLLDTTPTSVDEMKDAALVLGDTFTDPQYGLNFTPVAVGGEAPNQWIDVRVDLGATGSNRNPTVAILAPSTPPSARTPATFTASGSDPDGDTLYYQWDFGDGAINPTDSTISHRWLIGGTYTVTVAAIDGRGGRTTTSLEVTVSDPLLNWTRRASGLTGSSLTDVMFAGGQFVAVGPANSVALSPDGVTWTLAPSLITANGVTFGDGRYVAAGSGFIDGGFVGNAAYSLDGSTWQRSAVPAGATAFNKVAYGANRFVAVGAAGKIYASPDGATWSETPSGVTENLVAVRFADGVFVAVGNNGRILTSADGLAWANRTPANDTTNFTGVARRAGIWYVSAGGAWTWTSSDAIVWSKVIGSSSYFNANSLGTGAGLLLAPGNGGKIAFTEDAITWATTMPSPSTPDIFHAVAEGNGTVVAVGYSGVIYQSGTPILTAPKFRDLAGGGQLSSGQPASLAVDGAGYVKLELLVDGQRVAEIANPGSPFSWIPEGFGFHFLAVRGTTATGATMLSSPVQISTAPPWTQRASGLTSQSFNDLIFAGGQFLAPNSGAAVGLSTDGVTWVLAALPLTANGVTQGAGRYVTVGYRYVANVQTASAAYSADGLTWQLAATPTGAASLNKVAYGANRFVAVGASGKIHTSPDGAVWSDTPSGVTDALTAVRFADGVFVAVGNNGRILTSVDGLTWVNRTPANSSSYLAGVAHRTGNWYVSTGYSTWRSADSITWTTLGASPGTQANSLAPGAGLLLAPSSGGKIAFTESATVWATTMPSASTSDYFAAVAEGNGTVVAVGSNGVIYQAGTPTLIAPKLRDLAVGGQLTSGQPASLAVDGAGYVKLELLVDGEKVGEVTNPGSSFSWTPEGFGFHVLTVRGTTAVGAIMLSSPVQVSTTPLWTRRASGLTNQSFTDLIFAGGQFVAVGEGNSVALSTDGVTWTLTPSVISAKGVTYGGGRYVATGYRFAGGVFVGSAAYSLDGLIWQQGALPAGATALNKVAYGANRFVAVGEGGKIYTSPDGAGWSETPSGVADALTAVRFAEEIFVTTGSNGRILTSADGLTWVNRTPANFSANFAGVARRAGTWYVSSGYSTWQSADSIEWTTLGASAGTQANSLATGAGLVFAPSSGGKIVFTADATVWATAMPSASTSDNFNAVAEGNGTVVAVGFSGVIYQAGTPVLTAPKLRDLAGGGQLTSGQPAALTVDGVGYVKFELLVDGQKVAEVANSGSAFSWVPAGFGFHFLAVRGTTATGATILSVPIQISTAMPWTRRASGLTNQSFTDLIFAGGQFLAPNSGAAVGLSTDGVTWVLAALPLTANGVTQGAGRYVTVGYRYVANVQTASAAYSADGLTWQLAAAPTGAASLNKVAYGANRFVAVGASGKIYTSPDGAVWSDTPSGVTDALLAVRYADGVFVAAGNNGRILTSVDGLTWVNRTPANSSGNLTGVARRAGTWYASWGYSTWQSADSITWTTLGVSAGTQTNSLATGAGLLFAPSSGGKIAFTESATVWATTMPSTSTTDNFYAVAEGNGTVVAVGSTGVIYQAGTPALLAPALPDVSSLSSFSAGQVAALSVVGSGYTKLELLVDGRKVDEVTGSGVAFLWVPPRFGTYALAVRGTTASGASMVSTPVRVTATLADWVWRNPTPMSNNLVHAVRVGAKWWMVGNGGTMLTLDAGGNFTAVNLRSRNDLKAIAYGGGRFVIIGGNYDAVAGTSVSAVQTSTDGAVWQAAVVPGFPSLNSVAFDTSTGLWVAVGSNGVILTSPDGLVWSAQSSGMTAQLNSVARGGSQWITVGNGGQILTSPDGSIWTGRSSGTNNDLRGVVFDNGLWVAVGNYGTAVSSVDGIVWTARSSGTLASLAGIGVVNGRFVATGSGVTLSSSDALTWSLANLRGRTQSLSGIAGDAAGGMLLGLGGEILTSIDAINWTRRSQGATDPRTAVLYAGGRYVMASNAYDSAAGTWGAPLFSSDDGRVWTGRAAGIATNAQINALAFGQNTYVAAGYNGRIFTSGDAAVWSVRTSGSTAAFYAVASSPAVHVVAGADGTILSSADGQIWLVRTSGVSAHLRGGCFGNGRFILVGETGTILTSPDGISWTARASGVSSVLYAAIWAEGVGFVVVGANGVILTSLDGSVWTRQTSGLTDTLTAVAATPLGLVAVGNNYGRGIVSFDGVAWVGCVLPASQSIAGVAAGASGLVAVGSYGTVLQHPLTTDFTLPPSVNSQPADARVTLGQSASFVVGARGFPTPLTYRWQRLPAAGGGWTDLAEAGAFHGVSMDSLTVDPVSLALSGDQFRCIVGNGLAADATSAAATLTVSKASQSIAFGAIANRTYGAAAFAVSASSDSGLPVVLSVISGPANFSDGKVTISGTGLITLRASQPGGETFAAAPNVDQTFEVAKAALTVTATNQSRTFGAANPVLTLSYGGFVNGDTIAAITAPIASTTANTTSLPGTYPITVTGGIAANYALTLQSGTLTITPLNFAGTYFGTFASGGNWALYVRSDRTATYIAYLPSRQSAIVSNFTVNTNGTFSITGTEVKPTATAVSGYALANPEAPVTRTAAAASSYTLSGTIAADGGITGGLTGLGETFTGAVAVSTGAAQTSAGLYTASALGTANGTTYAIVGASGQAVIVTTSATAVDGATGTVNASGALTATTSNNAALALTINPTAHSVSASVTPSGSSTPVTYGGLASTVTPIARVVNLSVRTPAGTADQTLIVGLVIIGSGNKTLLLRGIGPTLSTQNVSNPLADPTMRLLNGSGAEISANNDWGGSTQMSANFAAVGAFALQANSKDAALFNTLSTGLYSFHTFPNGAGTGIVLAEVYDADDDSTTANVVNISARTQVGTGENILIAGFVITGNTPKTLLIRGLGPTLASQGVTGTLVNPQLYLFGSAGLLASNDDWGGTTALKSSFTATGAGALVSDTSKDAALLVTLQPGVYSAQVSGVASTTGVGLVEIFLVP